MLKTGLMMLIIQLLNYILKYIHIKTVILNCNNVSPYYCFYCVFDKKNCAEETSKTFKTYQPQCFKWFKVQGFFICHIINYTGYNQK